MSTKIQLEIYALIKEIVQMDRVSDQLNTTRGELKEANLELGKLDVALRRELRDIEQLEGLSTKAIFYQILGSKEKQLEKERQEYLELSLQEEDLINSIQILEYEVNLLSAKYSSSNQLKKDLEKLKRKREEEIIKSDPDLRIELLEISTELEETYQFKNELDEAIEVGSICQNLTQQIITHLSQVRDWGKWPAHRRRRKKGRNLRRDAIDRARNLAYQVKHHLNLFEKELADIGKQITFNADTSKFTQFSDFFFNNLITDWIMQQQLTQAINSANLLYRHLLNCMTELKVKRDGLLTDLEKLNNRRDYILTK